MKVYFCGMCGRFYERSKRVGLWLVFQVREGEFVEPVTFRCGICQVKELGPKHTSDPDSPYSERLRMNRG